ncbi:hypothetical protein ACEV89_12100, partial [Vibrio parahaemolyticus]
MAILVQSLAFVFMAQWFKLGGLRCSPLNAALAETEPITAPMLYLLVIYEILAILRVMISKKWRSSFDGVET